MASQPHVLSHCVVSHQACKDEETSPEASIEEDKLLQEARTGPAADSSSATLDTKWQEVGGSERLNFIQE